MIEIVPNWHPLFVHFTVALLSVAVVLFVLAALLKGYVLRGQWLTVARWNLWLGIGFAVITVIAGWYAYNTVAHDTPSHAAMTEHRNWALVTLAVFVLLGVWSVWRHRAGTEPNAPFLAGLVIALALLMSTAWHGGELVYRYGLGVMSLPKAEGDDHSHEQVGTEGHGHEESAAPAPVQAPAKEHADEPHGHSETDGHSHEEGRDRH